MKPAPKPEALSKIHYSMPSISDLEAEYATDAAANGWGPRCYDYIHRFERQFREHLGVKHAIATSSCTGALHMGYSALGIGPGDEVIIGDTAWVATASAITYVGATPVFVDILEDTWCLDPEKVEQAITPKTKAIVAIHTYGNLCDLDRLFAIGEKHKIPVIEDAAEALGSTWHGKPAGSLGTFGTFSFHGSKTLTTGEGGMFVTNDDELYKKVLTLNNHGRVPGQTKQFWSDVIGFKYKISNIQAALGCAQMERVDEIIRRKREVFQYYQQALADLPLAMNPDQPGCKNGYWMPTFVVDKDISFDRDAFMQACHDQNIDARVFFWPLTMMPMFEDKPENTVSYGLYSRAMNLPSYPDITTDEQDRVIAIIRDFLSG